MTFDVWLGPNLGVSNVLQVTCVWKIHRKNFKNLSIKNHSAGKAGTCIETYLGSVDLRLLKSLIQSTKGGGDFYIGI